MPPGTPYDFDWSTNGQIYSQGRNAFWDASGRTWEWLGDGFTPLSPGVYAFSFTVNGQRYDAGSITIEQQIAVQPAVPKVEPVLGAFTVFFTIDGNGQPSGYVFDKDRRQILPGGGGLTISGPALKPAPGDRIYLRTDAPRFSLLWDCGTSGGSLQPMRFRRRFAGEPAGRDRRQRCRRHRHPERFRSGQLGRRTLELPRPALPRRPNPAYPLRQRLVSASRLDAPGERQSNPGGGVAHAAPSPCVKWGRCRICCASSSLLSPGTGTQIDRSCQEENLTISVSGIIC